MRSAIILMLLGMLYGCASAVSSGYGQGGQNTDGRSYADAREDNRITAEVTSRFVEDHRVPAMDIDVSTVNGVVTLRGNVPDEFALKRAEALARSVTAVVRVVNMLSIR